MKDTVTLKELLAIAVRRGKLILILAVVFALLLGAVQGIRQVQNARSEDYSPETLEEQYQEALDAYNEERESLEESIQQKQDQLDSQEEYNDESLLMTLNPLNLYTSTVNLVVDHVVFPPMEQTILAESTLDFQTAKIQSQYQLYWDSVDLQTALEDQPYPDAKDTYLRELVSLKILDGGVLSVSAYGDSEADARALADAAVNCLLDGQQVIAQSACAHSFTTLSRVTKDVISTDIESRQETNLSNVESYSEELEDLQTQLEELKEPVKGSAPTVLSIAKSAIRWAVLGAVLGVILGMAWALVTYLFRNRAESTRQLAVGLEVPMLGQLFRKQDFWNVWADRILGERRWESPEEAQAYFRECAKAALGENRKVAVLSTLPLAEDSGMQDAVQTLKELGCQVCLVCDAGHSAQVVREIQESDAVILAERCGVSRWDEMGDCMALAQRLNTPVAGFVAL